MFYPREFKQRAKKAFPNLEELHKRIEKGDDFVHLYLRSVNCLSSVVDLEPGSLSIYTVLEASSLAKLKEQSKIEKNLILNTAKSSSTDSKEEAERRSTILFAFYPDKSEAVKCFLAPNAFSAREILNASSLKALKREAELRLARLKLYEECHNLYIEQNS